MKEIDEEERLDPTIPSQPVIVPRAHDEHKERQALDQSPEAEKPKRSRALSASVIEAEIILEDPLAYGGVDSDCL